LCAPDAAGDVARVAARRVRVERRDPPPSEVALPERAPTPTIYRLAAERLVFGVEAGACTYVGDGAYPRKLTGAGGGRWAAPDL
jgi:hypothetical protein